MTENVTFMWVGCYTVYPCMSARKLRIITVRLELLYEPSHEKTNNMTCAPSEDSDQPGHPRSLIRVFTVCSVSGSFMRTVKTLIRLRGCPGWSESSLDAQCLAKDPRLLHADSEDSDQIARMPRLV